MRRAPRLVFLFALVLVGCKDGRDTARELDPNAKCIELNASVYYCTVHHKTMLCGEDACLPSTMTPTMLEAIDPGHRDIDSTPTSSDL